MHGAAAKWDRGSFNWELCLVPGTVRHFISGDTQPISGKHQDAALYAQVWLCVCDGWHSLNMFTLCMCVCVGLSVCVRILICMRTCGLERLPSVGFVKSAVRLFFPPYNLSSFLTDCLSLDSFCISSAGKLTIHLNPPRSWWLSCCGNSNTRLQTYKDLVPPNFEVMTPDLVLTTSKKTF